MPLLRDTPIWVIDTETTGLDHKGDQLVEIAAVELRFDTDLWLYQRAVMWQTLVNPGVIIPVQSMAVHHITAPMLQGSPPPEEALQRAASIIPANAVVCAQNAEFDYGFLSSLHDRKWLCTKRLAQHVWPEAPAYSNQVLRYWLDVEADLAGMLPHRALADAIVTAAVLVHTLDEHDPNCNADVDELIEYAESPVLQKTLRFGSKHRDMPLDQVPDDYLRWMLREIKDLDRDVRYSVETQLLTRAQGAA